MPGLRSQWTEPQYATMQVVYAEGATVPCGHPPPCSVIVDEFGEAKCLEPGCGDAWTLEELKEAAS